jgi:3-oxoacyl-[acyl-carrier protein] reductase
MTAGRFQDRTVFVTGSGRGFGAVLARAFAREGAHIVVHYNSSASGAEETAATVRQLGRKALVVQGNIASLADVQRMTAQAFAEVGRRRARQQRRTWRSTKYSARWTSRSHTKWTSRNDVHDPRSTEDDGPAGRAIATSVQVVIAGSPRGHSTRPRSTVIGLTKSYARALAPNVRVNTLGAAFMETEALKNRHDWKTGRREEILRQTPLARIAQPEDMVGPTLFLASAESGFITGQFLLCNGGLAMVGA